MNTVAIVGTAGRDKSFPMTTRLWWWMLNDVAMRVPPGACLISGGAAWADHLAVTLFNRGDAPWLTLCLPAPFERNRFCGPRNSAGSAANYYHEQFSAVLGIRSLREIGDAINEPTCDVSYEPYQEGYAGMFARNKKVAKADMLIAYTFGRNNEPADGGTKNTWDMCKGERIHVSLFGAN